MPIDLSAVPLPKPCRVLIAEDEPAMAHAIQRVLRGVGFETMLAADGMVTRSLLSSFQPSLITLDLFMPNVDGIALLEFMREVGEVMPALSCRTLVVSGASQEWLQLALELGADGVLAKPFTNEALLERVGYVLGDKHGENLPNSDSRTTVPSLMNWREQARTTNADEPMGP